MRIAKRNHRDLIVIPILAGGLITLLGMGGLTHGSLVDAWVSLLARWFGMGAVALPLTAIIAGVAASIAAQLPWKRVIALELLFFAGLAMLSILSADSLTEAEMGQGGGIIGWAIAAGLRGIAGTIGRLAILFLVVGFATYWLLERRRRTELGTRSAEDPKPKERAPTRSVPSEFRKEFKLPGAESPEAGVSAPRQAHLPSLGVLEAGKTKRVTAKDINRSAGLIEKTLSEFGLPAKVVDFRSGPAVTQFAVEPGYVEQRRPDGTVARNKVRVGQISALANDLALALSASTIRIEAPVPGKAYVGVEVPNRKPELVRLRPIIESSDLKSPMAIALGRDVAGSPVVADLAEMPHLLIAGTTGSGKSVCIASIATCLALNNAPEDLQFVMIDPKRVELLRFNGLPHLVGRVETELARIAGVLQWCTVEMDRRFRLLEEASARDLASYNKKAGDDQQLPRMVVLIDELADLMMLAPDQTESALVRLAQMARATGIHLVVATQRPSTDVVTGLIKANFPARIAFAVASATDSRVILDTAGAESLMGQGDMLYLAPEAAGAVRLQGAFVGDKEIDKLIKAWKGEGAQSAPWEEFLARRETLSEKDDILEAAIEVVRSSGQASASLLQRRLRIGYPRAARLMDELEELGVIGRSQAGGRTREVLIPDDDEAAS